ncbi:MAG: glycine betaine ABC transporter substrate-binding protein [Treponema sp.]|nr:glycine betaine ABC transporter substrate-binding protein [Treponema sp.]MDY4674101.1 glycine betaine ABC transporter substrate-binding protein [Treponema sp.]
MKIKFMLPALVVACMLVTGTAFAGGKKEAPQGGTVHMATKSMTEQFILASMMKTLIEQDTDLTVKLTEGVGGGTMNIQPAMVKGEFDFYPEYTGTGWNNVLKMQGLYSEALFDQLVAGYKELGMSWVGMLGFNNTYGIAVRTEIAQQYNLKTLSDLAAVAPQLVFGANYDFFERLDGFDALCQAYGLKFKDTVDMEMGLKYDAIRQKEIDVVNAFTTDGQLFSSNVTVLADDKGFYPSYMCGFVVRDEVLAAHPELLDVFKKVENILTDEKMATMNYQVEVEGQDPEAVATNFLKEAGLVK